MKKVVLKLDLHDDKEKQKAFKAVSGVYGIDKVGVDMELQRMTIVGTVDPVAAVGKLRKLFPTTQILYVGPANKMPAKKEVNKKQQEEKPVYPPPHWWYVGHGAGAEADPNTGVICWPNTRRGNRTTY